MLPLSSRGGGANDADQRSRERADQIAQIQHNINVTQQAMLDQQQQQQQQPMTLVQQNPQNMSQSDLQSQLAQSRSIGNMTALTAQSTRKQPSTHSNTPAQSKSSEYGTAVDHGQPLSQTVTPIV